MFLILFQLKGPYFNLYTYIQPHATKRLPFWKHTAVPLNSFYCYWSNVNKVDKKRNAQLEEEIDILFDNFNFGNNVSYKYINFNYDIKMSLKKQIHILSEDILQVQYDNGYIIDIGWYPAFNLQGSFKIVLSKYKYDNIICQKNCNNTDDLINILIDFIGIVDSSLNERL